MTLSDEWVDLERRLPPGGDGRMTRRILPEAAVEIQIVAQRGGHRGLELLVAPEALHEVVPPPSTRAVRLDVEPAGAVRLILTDPAAGDLFAALCEDVTEATRSAQSDPDAVSLWLGRFSRWKRLLQAGADGLSDKRQRGLYAELWTVENLLGPTVGALEAVESWKGPDGAPRDFETSGIGIETKSSAANEPQVVPINGERQLDDAGLDALYLVHLSLEVLRDAGRTLPDIVLATRQLARDGPAQGLLEDRLLDSGYADAHDGRYARTGYDLRRVSVFDVGEGFPRIVEGELTDGVGGVHYRLAIDACRDFEVETRDLTERVLGRGG